LFVRDNCVERDPFLPSEPFEIGLRGEAIDVAKAEVGNDHKMIRNIEELADFFRVEDADPADSDAFAASGEPEVVDSTNGGIAPSPAWYDTPPRAQSR
jgi:hypothetical protein